MSRRWAAAVARFGHIDILVNDDVCGAIIFLASPAASLITGDTIMIDGGWTAR